MSELLKKARSRVLKCWYDPDWTPRPFSALSFLVSVGTGLYAAGAERNRRRALKNACALPALAISVGNLTLGGTGKTPLVLWLAERFQGRGLRTAVLSRGYGRRGSEAAPVPADGDTAPLVPLFGDEPVLMARKTRDVPVWVGTARCISGKAAIRSSGAQILIMDDGFQHLSLQRDLDLVLMDAGNPFGNGLLLPFGPLREPMASLHRADAFILTRSENPGTVHRTRRLLETLFPGKPVFAARHRLTGFGAGLGGRETSLATLASRTAVAFAGIAHPHSFFRSLESTGAILARSFPFPDHHRYTARDIKALLDATRETGSSFLVTTEKDAVRLPAEIQSAVATAVIRMDFGEELKGFSDFLDEKLSSLPPTP